jgi:uncharacterized protein YeaO (DUF488 family)
MVDDTRISDCEQKPATDASEALLSDCGRQPPATATQVDLLKIFQEDPNFRRQFDALEGARNSASEPKLDGGRAADGYRNEAFKGMIQKYGLERVKQTFAGLEQMAGRPDFYGHDLRVHYGQGQEDLDKKLGMLASLMEPGRIEQAQNAQRQLNADGYTRKLSLAQASSPEFVNALVTDPKERAALIEFEQQPFGPLMRFHREHRDLDLNKMMPSEQLARFREWEKGDQERLRAENKPFTDEIAAHGKDAPTALADAVRQNRVVMIGETHEEENPHRAFGATIMQGLKDAGATHLAVELTPDELREFTETGDMAKLPPGLRTQSYVDMLKAARTAELQLVPINLGDDSGGFQARDDHMAAEISKVLDANRNNKVVAWVGNLHAADTTAGAHQSTADLLRPKYSVATVLDQFHGTLDPLPHISKDVINGPTVIRTADAPNISKLEFLRTGNDIQERYGLWDMVLIHPPHKP